MSIKKLNLSLGANDPSKSTFNNFSYFSKWARAIKSGLTTVEHEWNRLFLPFFSDMPTDEDIDPWIHGLDGKTLYGDANAPISNKDYSNGTRPYTLKDIFDRVYTSISTHANDIQALKRRAERLASSASSGSSSSSGYPPNYISGLNFTYTDVDQITVSTGYCRSDDNTTDIELDSDTLMDIDSDLDVGTESSDAWYYIWLFYNPTTEAISLKFSLQYPGSGTDPTAPAGYTKKRYLGSVRNSSGDFLNFTQVGDRTREIIYNESGSGVLRVLSNGTATSYTVVSTNNGSYTDPQELVPPMASLQYISMKQETTSRIGVVKGSGLNVAIFTNSGTNKMAQRIPVGTGQELEYYSSGGAGSVTIAILGYIESL